MRFRYAAGSMAYRRTQAGPVYVIPNATTAGIPVDLDTIPARMKTGKFSFQLTPTGSAWDGTEARIFHPNDGDEGDSANYMYLNNPDGDTTYIRIRGTVGGVSTAVNNLYIAQTRAQFAAAAPFVVTVDLSTGVVSSPGWTLESAATPWTWNFSTTPLGLGVGHRLGYNDRNLHPIASLSEVIEA